MARPTTYKPEYCDRLIEWMSKGMSFESFAGTIPISLRVLAQWATDYPEFQQAKESGMVKCRIVWEQIGLAAATGKIQTNASIWIFNMKNRFGWRDHYQIDQTTTVQISTKPVTPQAIKEIVSRDPFMELPAPNGGNGSNGTSE